MTRTPQLDLPLLMPAQAQKHVTVNEALARLDAIAQLRVLASDVMVPPASINDGTSYLVPNGAVGAWEGRAGKVAIWSNGGWVYAAPRAGWRAWDESRKGHQLFDGVDWIPDAICASVGGAALTTRVVEFEHPLTAGTNNATTVTIPNQAQVIGITGRVKSALSGSGLTGWSVGVPGSNTRYGSGLGLAKNSYLIGLSGTPVTYYADTPLLLSAEGGSFAAGTIAFALHIVQLNPPRAFSL